MKINSTFSLLFFVNFFSINAMDDNECIRRLSLLEATMGLSDGLQVKDKENGILEFWDCDGEKKHSISIKDVWPQLNDSIANVAADYVMGPRPFTEKYLEFRYSKFLGVEKNKAIDEMIQHIDNATEKERLEVAENSWYRFAVTDFDSNEIKPEWKDNRKLLIAALKAADAKAFQVAVKKPMIQNKLYFSTNRCLGDLRRKLLTMKTNQ